jgi:hypothetical protein
MSSLDIGTPGSYFWSRAFNEVVKPRGSHDETQPRKSHEKPSDSTRCFAARTHGRKGSMRDWEVSLHSIISKSSVLHDQCALHHFLVLTLPLVNLEMRFLLREKVVTPRIMVFLITFIRGSFMCQLFWLIETKEIWFKFNLNFQIQVKKFLVWNLNSFSWVELFTRYK